jgi:hypothetical protein
MDARLRLAEPLRELLEGHALRMVGQLAQRSEDAVDADETVLDLTNAHSVCDDPAGWCNGVPLSGIY